MNLCEVLPRRCCRRNRCSRVAAMSQGSADEQTLAFSLLLFLNQHLRDGKPREEAEAFRPFCSGDAIRRSDYRGCISFEQLVPCRGCEFHTNKRSYL